MKNKALASGIWYTISNFLLKGLTLISTPVFTRLMSKSEFGEFSAYVSLMGIVQVFACLNVGSSMLPAKYDYSHYHTYVSSITVLGFLSSLVCLVVMLVLNVFDKSILGLENKYIVIMVLYLFLSSCLEIFVCEKQLFYQYKTSVILNLSTSVFTFVLSVVLVLCSGDKFGARVIGSSIPVILAGFFVAVIIMKRGGKADLSCWKYALPICLPFIPHILSLNLLSSMDRIMIKNMCGAEPAAIYSVSYTCGHMITILTTSLNTAFVPWLADKVAANREHEVKKFSYVYFSLYCFLAVGIMLFAPEVLFILGGSSYMEGISVIGPVAMGCICQFVYIMYVNLEQIKKKTFGMALASISAAVLNYALNMIFIPKYGYIAASYTTLAGYLWLMLIHMILVKKMGYYDVYDGRFMWIVLIGILLLMTGIQFLYQTFMIRMAAVVLYAAILIILFVKYRKRMIYFLKK